MATFYAHLPFVRVAGFTSFQLPALRLEIAQLPFDKWEKMDGGFAGLRNQESRYHASAPVFVIVSDAADFEAVEKMVSLAHLAVVLGSAARVPSPQLSMQYLVSGRSVRRSIGPFAREVLLYHSDTVRCVIDELTAARVVKMSNLIVAATHVLSAAEIQFAIRSLNRGALTGVSEMGNVALCLVAAEEIVMGRITNQLTATFSRRAGVLMTPHAHLREKGEAHARDLYRLRSCFLHGEADAEILSDETIISSARYLLVRAVVATLAAVTNGLLSSDSVSYFGELLDSAANTPLLREQLHEAMPR